MVLPIAEVTWLDARFRSRNEAVSVATQDRGYIRRTVGYVVRDDLEYVVLAMTFDGDQDKPGDEAEVDDRLTVPRGMVLSMRMLT